MTIPLDVAMLSPGTYTRSCATLAVSHFFFTEKVTSCARTDVMLGPLKPMATVTTLRWVVTVVVPATRQLYVREMRPS